MKILFFFTREDIDVVMVTEKMIDSSFNITIELEFDFFFLRRKRTLSLGFVKMVNRINLTIFDYNQTSAEVLK